MVIRRSARTDVSAGQVTLGDYIQDETAKLEVEDKSLGQIAYETYHSLANPTVAFPWKNQSEKVRIWWKGVAEAVVRQIAEENQRAQQKRRVIW